MSSTYFPIGDKRMAHFRLVLVYNFTRQLLVVFRLDEDPLVLEVVIKLIRYIHRAAHSLLNSKLKLTLTTIPPTRRTIPTSIIGKRYRTHPAHIHKHSNSNRHKNNRPNNKTDHS